jgi:hypothetical protein
MKICLPTKLDVLNLNLQKQLGKSVISQKSYKKSSFFFDLWSDFFSENSLSVGSLAPIST